MQRGAAAPHRLSFELGLAALGWPLGFFVLDRAVKYLVYRTGTPAARGWWYVGYAHNSAGPLSLPVPNAWLIAVGCGALLLAAALAWAAWQRGQALTLAAIALIVVSGASNLMDRVALGGVVDVFHLTVFSTLSFNLADLGILAGLGLLVLAW